MEDRLGLVAADWPRSESSCANYTAGERQEAAQLLLSACLAAMRVAMKKIAARHRERPPPELHPGSGPALHGNGESFLIPTTVTPTVNRTVFLVFACLMVAMLLASLDQTISVSGQIESKAGRYTAIPIIRTVLVTIGLTLLSSLLATTSGWIICVHLAIMGVGLRMSTQSPPPDWVVPRRYSESLAPIFR